MLIRFVSLVLCLAGIIAVSITIYDGGWSSYLWHVKLAIVAVGGVSASILSFLVLVSDETIARWNLEAQMRNRRASLGKPLY